MAAVTEKGLSVTEKGLSVTEKGLLAAVDIFCR